MGLLKCENVVIKYWRGALARRLYKKMKAANVIATAYKKYKTRIYIQKLNLAYGYFYNFVRARTLC